MCSLLLKDLSYNFYFVEVLPYMGMTGLLVAILVMRPGSFIYTLVPPFLQMFRIKFGFDWPSGSREEDVLILW